MTEKKVKFKERKPLFALALSLFLVGLGHVYNGKPKKGILLFLIWLSVPFLIFQLSVIGPDETFILFILLSILTSLGIYIWAAVDAWNLAKRIEKNYYLKFYNKLSVYILFLILLNLFSLGLIFDWQKICFFASPYKIASESMKPSILPGDYIMADKRIDRSVENLGLERGDIMVFKHPKNKKRHIIKRLIGLPGDEITLKGTEVFVNGEKLTGKEVFPPKEIKNENIRKKTKAFSEQSDLESYVVFYLEGSERKNLSVSVPKDFCFVLSDNRDRSMDSRHWGMVPLENIIARADQIYFSLDPGGGIRWKRIGKVIY